MPKASGRQRRIRKARPHHHSRSGDAPQPRLAPAEISAGIWNCTVETSQGTGTPVFTFVQEGEKITGTYKGSLGEAPLTGTLKGNDISFSLKGNFQGQDVNATYTGKVEGNTMKAKP